MVYVLLVDSLKKYERVWLYLCMKPRNSFEVAEKWNPKILKSIIKANKLFKPKKYEKELAMKKNWRGLLQKTFIYSNREQRICWRRKTKYAGSWVGRPIDVNDIIAYIKEFLLPKNGN